MALSKLQQTALISASRVVSDYILKIAGRQEYLLECSIALSKLVYIRECIKRKIRIEFIAIEREIFMSKIQKKVTLIFLPVFLIFFF